MQNEFQKYDGHDTYAEGYNRTGNYRLAINFFFQDLIGKVRGKEKPFLKDERILDIGCGPQKYFLNLWEKHCDIHVTGIDKKNDDISDETFPLDRRLICHDLFAYDPANEQQFDVVYSSFAQTWMLSNYEKDVFWKKVYTLLSDKGYYCAHYPGERNYFPDYNTLIMHCLMIIGSPLGKAKAYWQARDRIVSQSDSLEEILNSSSIAGLDTLLLTKTLEWIPFSQEDYLSYWESGGRPWLLDALDKDQCKYDEFRQVLKNTINSESKLKTLGIRLFEKEGSKLLLLPAWHIYHIARKQQVSIQNRCLKIRPKVFGRSLKAHAAIRMDPQAASTPRRLLHELESLTEDLSGQKGSDVVYVAKINIDGGNEVGRVINIDDDYGSRFQHLKTWVEFGKKAKLPTLTQALENLKNTVGYSIDNPAPVGVIGYILEKSYNSISKIIDIANAEHEINEVSQLAMLLPEGTLERANDLVQAYEKKLRIQEDSVVTSKHQVYDDSISDGLGCDFLPHTINAWPKLFMFSDSDVAIVKGMTQLGSDSNDYTQPLRYFDWQCRTTAPDSQLFVVASTLARVAGDVPHLQSLFAMVKHKSKQTQYSVSEYMVILEILLTLGGLEIVRAKKEGAEVAAYKEIAELYRRIQDPLKTILGGSKKMEEVLTAAEAISAILGDNSIVPTVDKFKTLKDLLTSFFETTHEIHQMTSPAICDVLMTEDVAIAKRVLIEMFDSRIQEFSDRFFFWYNAEYISSNTSCAAAILKILFNKEQLPLCWMSEACGFNRERLDEKIMRTAVTSVNKYHKIIQVIVELDRLRKVSQPVEVSINHSSSRLSLSIHDDGRNIDTIMDYANQSNEQVEPLGRTTRSLRRLEELGFRINAKKEGDKGILVEIEMSSTTLSEGKAIT